MSGRVGANTGDLLLAKRVLAVLREVLGPEGLLVFPAQTYTLAHNL